MVDEVVVLMLVVDVVAVVVVLVLVVVVGEVVVVVVVVDVVVVGEVVVVVVVVGPTNNGVKRFTCTFMGDWACETHCYTLNRQGGWCDSRNVCNCRQERIL
ncbi:hypothetical protein MAR_001515 [Mya arenaria]|uniref:Invertebrate defensins family profile domain-containing protein n=1 Tax=Mya arenaria TaxID=6604 RepID=A0ABY7FFB7_MYAAR|nr:hypothetical protein MAR_001515 [Mya arenaria]